MVAPVHGQQLAEVTGGGVVVAGALGDVGERLEGDHVLTVELEHADKGRLRGGIVAKVELAAAQDNAGGDVVGVAPEAIGQHLEGAVGVLELPVRLRERREGVALRILPPQTLEPGDLAAGHPFPFQTR